jgi:uncharacterized protein (TIGR02145 family)
MRTKLITRKGKVSLPILAATFGLALAFTLSCSSDDSGGDGDNKGGSGGNSANSCPNASTGGNNTVTCGGETYETVTIGTQTWMAKNLNHDVEGSVCYDNDPANCTKYGRLYDQETARAICPKGWRLPKNDEWTTLGNFVGSGAGTKLKATEGWDEFSTLSTPEDGNGTDDHGFKALPGGTGYVGSFESYSSIGRYGYWWSEDEFYSDYAYCAFMASSLYTLCNIEKW